MEVGNKISDQGCTTSAVSGGRDEGYEAARVDLSLRLDRLTIVSVFFIDAAQY